MNLDVIRPGRVPYSEAYELQKELQAKRIEGQIPDTLLLLEHPPVITIGKRGKDCDVLISPDMLAAQGVELFETNRGGEVTYHGPGQMVGYLIFDVTEHGKDLHRFVHDLEQVFIDYLAGEYGIEAARNPEHTGVWVGDEKITAIGIAVRKWVSMHGFAFNIDTNLDHFSLIVPCGIRDKGVTSLNRLISNPADVFAVEEELIGYFLSIFGFSTWKQKEIQRI